RCHRPAAVPPTTASTRLTRRLPTRAPRRAPAAAPRTAVSRIRGRSVRAISAAFAVAPAPAREGDEVGGSSVVVTAVPFPSVRGSVTTVDPDQGPEQAVPGNSRVHPVGGPGARFARPGQAR